MSHLADHVVNERFLGNEAPELFVLLQRFLVLFHREQNRRSMKLAQRVLGLDDQRPVQNLQGLVGLLERVVHDRYVHHQRRAVRINEQRFFQILFGQQKLLLLKVNHADAVPGVVVSWLEKDGLAERRQALVHLFDENVLVAEQIVGVRELGVDLGGPVKKLDGRVVLLVQAEAVADHAPSLGRQLVELVVQFKVGFGHLAENKARVELAVGQLLEALERLLALKLLQAVHGRAHVLEQLHHLVQAH
ncbi:hypothetical protein BpHYR1_003657 [Brachionus plicatilis]|uniref:Uncharacterized protein n=1 Tax=Brachionus plicatilis TaxID=10195 RepID=A0A3M7R8X6_BRAPC|nr:hypothetical protein BpHYR1_003657 [Brachionus plicatilis]